MTDTMSSSPQLGAVDQTSFGEAFQGGRFDFDDGGTYCGGWQDGKAHGWGVCTGPKGMGEYAGSWRNGYEESGVYTWPSGSIYEGTWLQGRKHGLGIEIKGKWIFRGEWTNGFKGRYGVRQSTATGAKYEGTWTTGFQDGYGCETYADGSTYQGQFLRGQRHGFGIRQSVPYGVAHHHSSAVKSLRESMTSLAQLGDGGQTPAHDIDGRSINAEGRGGFVLTAGSDDEAERRKTHLNKLFDSKTKTKSKSKLSLFTGFKLKKQKSTGDLHKQNHLGHTDSDDERGKGKNTKGRSSSSVRSNYSNYSGAGAADAVSMKTFDSVGGFLDHAGETIRPDVIETYRGEWKQDARCGHGISERSDGLKYEGEWLANKKHGYGCTTFPDGRREEGKYRGNVLVASTQKKGRLFMIRSSKIRERCQVGVDNALRSVDEANHKADTAIQRMSAARQKSDQAELKAENALSDCEKARRMATRFAADFHQPGFHPQATRDLRRSASVAPGLAASDGEQRRSRSTVRTQFSQGRDILEKKLEEVRQMHIPQPGHQLSIQTPGYFDMAQPPPPPQAFSPMSMGYAPPQHQGAPQLRPNSIPNLVNAQPQPQAQPPGNLQQMQLSPLTQAEVSTPLHISEPIMSPQQHHAQMQEPAQHQQQYNEQQQQQQQQQHQETAQAKGHEPLQGGVGAGNDDAGSHYSAPGLTMTAKHHQQQHQQQQQPQASSQNQPTNNPAQQQQPPQTQQQQYYAPSQMQQQQRFQSMGNMAQASQFQQAPVPHHSQQLLTTVQSPMQVMPGQQQQQMYGQLMSPTQQPPMYSPAGQQQAQPPQRAYSQSRAPMTKQPSSASQMIYMQQQQQQQPQATITTGSHSNLVAAGSASQAARSRQRFQQRSQSTNQQPMSSMESPMSPASPPAATQPPPPAASLNGEQPRMRHPAMASDAQTSHESSARGGADGSTSSQQQIAGGAGATLGGKKAPAHNVTLAHTSKQLRGSLPDVSKVDCQPSMNRLEAAELSRQRREERRDAERHAAERASLNPKAILSDIFAWVSDRQLVIFLIALNVSLAAIFINLIS